MFNSLIVVHTNRKGMIVRHTFEGLLHHFTNNEPLIVDLWGEMVKNYSGSKRHYHTLQHLENVLLQLQEVKTQINSWEAVLFTLFYHDVVYNSLKSDNEEKSAVLAEKRMVQIGAPKELIQLCKEQILATKSHGISKNRDTNYFTDADLSILGATWEEYENYFENVRKEYSIYPDLVYKPGRKKVLNHFLVMERIYKTAFFCTKFEKQARENIRREILML